jgi:hypothetical protein
MVSRKGFGSKLSWPYLRYYPGIRLEELRKTTKILNHDSLSPGPRFEPETSRMRSRNVVNHPTMTFVRVAVRNRVSSDWEVLEGFVTFPIAANVVRNPTTVWFLFWPGQLSKKKYAILDTFRYMVGDVIR